MAIGTYAQLQASVASWLKRTDLAANIPDFVTLCESRLARDLRLRRMIATTTLSTTAGTRAIALPDDWLETENLTITSGGVAALLGYMTPEQMDVRLPVGAFSGVPGYFTTLGANLVVAPTPDAAYSVSMDYYARIPALADAPTNWLLTTSPAIYLFGTLAEASPFTFDDERTALWEQKYQAEVMQLQGSDDTALRSGSVLRVRSA